MARHNRKPELRKAILVFMLGHYEREGRPPTMAELREEFGLTRSSIHRHLDQLEAKGYIVIDTDNRSRFRVIRNAEKKRVRFAVLEVED
jgi:DNA-binding MarR family transcriptional regulator